MTSRWHVNLRGVLGALVALSMCPATSHAESVAGSIDTTYGVGGTAQLPAGVAWKHAAVTPLDDGRAYAVVAAAGSVQIARIDERGHPDATWGSGGLVTVPAGGPVRHADIAVDARGGVVVAGDLQQADRSSFLVRLDGSGLVDGAFGGGLRRLDMPVTRDVLVAGERVLVSGSAPSSTFSVIRAFDHVSGALDAGFGADGTALVDDTGAGTALQMVVDGTGRIIASFTHEGLSPLSDSALGLVRLGADGSLDTAYSQSSVAKSFGYGAYVTGLRFVGSGSLLVGRTNRTVSFGGPGKDRATSTATVLRADDLGAVTRSTNVPGSWSYVDSMLNRPGGGALVVGSSHDDPLVGVIDAEGVPVQSFASGGFASPRIGTGQRPDRTQSTVVLARDGDVIRVVTSGRPDKRAPALGFGIECMRNSGWCVDPHAGRPTLRWEPTDDSDAVWTATTATGITSATAHRFPASEEVSCAHLQAVDAVGRSSRWTRRCMAITSTEAGFDAAGRWRARRSVRLANGRALVTADPGATARTSRSADALVVTLCPRCGSIAVTRGRWHRTIDLRRPTTRFRAIVRLGGRGPASIRVVRRGSIQLDGFATFDAAGFPEGVCDDPGQVLDVFGGCS